MSIDTITETTEASPEETVEPTTTVEETVYSPYECARKVNAWLAGDEIEKVLPPQMFYTYVKKAYIKSIDVDGKRKVTNDQLREWYVGYAAKQNALAARKAEVAAMETTESE